MRRRNNSESIFRAGPEGFAYQDGILSEEEESGLLDRLSELCFGPAQSRAEGWSAAVFGSRGGEANLAANGVAEPLLGWLVPLRDRAAALAGLPGEAFVHADVKRYPSGAALDWRREPPEYGKIVSVSLVAPVILRFRVRERAAWRRSAAALAPRSAYLLDGPARLQWEHSIPAVTTPRFTVTFRSLRA